ncbi:MAG: hypothetical protein JW737_01070 [Acidobacteria bacterium]|nr:hypothetical protein [Acidobacteriota bacterium]
MRFVKNYLIVMFLFLYVFVSAADAAKVTIYKMKNFNGKSVVLTGDTPNLMDPAINMNDKVNSIKLDNAISVALFEHTNYKGKCQKFTSDVVNLDVHEIGTLGISSIKINADCPPPKNGIIFYDKKNYNGTSKKITSDESSLIYFKVNSVKLDGVSSVALFTKSNYEGNCHVFTSDVPNFDSTDMVENEVGSVKMNGNCNYSGPYMFVFEGKNYTGKRYRLTSDAANLDNRYWVKMKNKVSSLKMYNMNSAALFQAEDYNGKCYTMTANIPDMGSTIIKDNKLASIKLNSECGTTTNFLKMRNNSAAVVKFEWKNVELSTWEHKRLAAGQEIIMNFDPETNYEVVVYYIYPSASTLNNFQEIKEKCRYTVIMNDNHAIFAKGTLMNPSCDYVTIPSP